MLPEISECRLYSGEQVGVLVKRGQLGMCSLDGVGGTEKESRLACLDHAEIVEAVAACNSLIAD